MEQDGRVHVGDQIIAVSYFTKNVSDETLVLCYSVIKIKRCLRWQVKVFLLSCMCTYMLWALQNNSKRREI